MPKAYHSKPLGAPTPRAVLRAWQHNHPHWNWAQRRRTRRALIAAYLLTLAALAMVGWIDALQHGWRGHGSLWIGLLTAVLVEQAVLDKATRGLFRLPVQDLDERQRAMRELGYRYGFRIMAGATTALLAAGLYLPTDRLLTDTNRLEWIAIAVAVVYLLWMVPTMVVAWLEPDDPTVDEEATPP